MSNDKQKQAGCTDGLGLLYAMGFEDCQNPEVMCLYLHETATSVLVEKSKSYTIKELVKLIDKSCAAEKENAVCVNREGKVP